MRTKTDTKNRFTAVYRAADKLLFLCKPGIYLEDLFVLEEHRGKGFGKVLLTYLAKLAVEKNCGRLEWAVLDWNEPSIEFYKSLGAK